jgi:hypothetical protein
MNIINYTPHEISIKQNGEFIKIAPSGVVCRVSQKTVKVSNINGIDIFASVFGDVENAPPVDENVYIVSALCKQKLKDTGSNNVYSPGQLIRDEKGNVIGCNGLEK